MVLSHLLLTLGWIGYGLIHSLLASVPIKEKFRRLLGLGFRYYRLAYSLIALGLLALLIFWQLRTPSLQMWEPNLYTRIPASILVLLGLASIIICLKKYLISREGFSDLFFEGKKPALQIKGLHRLVRHPLYLSTFIFLTGLLIAFPFLSFALSTIVIIGYTVFAIPLEEQKLVELYGQEYLRYKKEVPALIPNQLTNWLIR
jgi:protein-S-isoprenylcysteine O-methyltransferase Ste14